jgi:hypothetical protein
MQCCLKCGHEVEKDDNFCPSCGHWTAKGYSFLKDKNNENIVNGIVVKRQNRLTNLFVLMFLFIIIFIVSISIRGISIFKPITYIKHQILNNQYGYNTTILKTNNQYFNEKINTLEEAKKFIKKDISNQEWECYSTLELSTIEDSISTNYDIPSVSFCEIKKEEVEKIKEVIDEVYTLFPNIKGYLTNITLTNAKNSKDYVAYFQPIYEFTNTTSDLTSYNKINKTQILLNSYYFLNSDILNSEVTSNWYVNGSTYYSLIAHEFGHYISFVSLLKTKGISNVTLVNNENKSQIDEVLNIINDESYSKDLVDIAITNYNNKYNTDIYVDDFAKLISNYAASKNSKGNILYDEIIAEAFHDYYLNKKNASSASLEIINILKERIN